MITSIGDVDITVNLTKTPLHSIPYWKAIKSPTNYTFTSVRTRVAGAAASTSTTAFASIVGGVHGGGECVGDGNPTHAITTTTITTTPTRAIRTQAAAVAAGPAATAAVDLDGISTTSIIYVPIADIGGGTQYNRNPYRNVNPYRMSIVANYLRDNNDNSTNHYIYVTKIICQSTTNNKKNSNNRSSSSRSSA